MIVKANCRREIRRGSRSMRSILEQVSISRPQSLPSFGGSGRWIPWGPAGPALRQLVFEPQIVMLLGPIEIDFAGPHGLERPPHSKRADIDMTEDQGDEQDG